MPRRIEDERETISRAVAPSRNLIALAKLYLRSRAPTLHEPAGTPTADLLDGFATQQDARKPDIVWVHEEAPTDELAAEAVRYLSAIISAAQGLLELTQSGEFIPVGTYAPQHHNIRYSTAYRGSGNSGSWLFEDLSYPAAPRVLVPAYWDRLRSDPMTDPDIYVLEAGLAAADIEVSDSAREAVACLRAELYTSAVVMLGKVMEGAWIEMGLALAGICPDLATKQRLESLMRSDTDSTARKVRAVRDAYGNAEWFKTLWRAAEVQPAELDATVIWSDLLRDARNGIHFGVRPLFANAPEKVGVLFLSGAQNLQRIYRIVAAAR